MGVSTFFGLGKATDRILKRYGTRSGTIINATGTGTVAYLIAAPKHYFPSEDAYNATSKLIELCTAGQGESWFLEVSAFSNEIEPIRVSSTSQIDYRRTLTGGVVGFHKYGDIEVSLGIIGNSLDDYRLTMLSNMAKDCSIAPLFNMWISSNSAPGYENVMYECGVIEDFNPGMSIGTNSKIRDKVFNFKFSNVSSPTWSNQNYDPTETPNIFEDMIGL